MLAEGDGDEVDERVGEEGEHWSDWEMVDEVDLGEEGEVDGEMPNLLDRDEQAELEPRRSFLLVDVKSLCL